MVKPEMVGILKGLPPAAKAMLSPKDRWAFELYKTCGSKKGYTTERGAIQSSDNPGSTRAYKCKHCQLWHRSTRRKAS